MEGREKLKRHGDAALALLVSLVVVLFAGSHSQLIITSTPSPIQLARENAGIYQPSFFLQTIMRAWKPMAEELQRYVNAVGNEDMAANARQILFDTSRFRLEALTSWKKSVNGTIDTEAWLEKAKMLFTRAVRELEYSSAKTSMVRTTEIGQVAAIVEARRALLNAVFDALREVDRRDLGSNMDYKMRQKLDKAIENGDFSAIGTYVNSITDVLRTAKDVKHQRVGSALAKLLPTISYSN